MELLLGAGIALLQVLVLPGWLCVRALRLDADGPLQTALYTFVFSLVANHALVAVLVLLGAYTRPVLHVVGVVEILLVLWLARRPGPARRPPAELLGVLLESRSLLGLGLLAAGSVGFLASRVAVSFTLPFEYWDAIVSWNRWAVDWEAGRLPGRTYHYPQLLPTTWSLLYVLTGHPLQHLARGVMALFPLCAALAFVDLGLRRRSPVPLLACSFTTLLMALALGHHIGAGMADLPVAGFAMLALHPLVVRDFAARDPDARSRLAACAVAGIGCALTKQAGLYVAVLLPVYAALALRAWPARTRLAAVAVLAAALLAGIAPWYGWAELQVARGLEVNELPLLTQKVFGDATLWQRAAHAASLWQGILTPPLLLAAVVLVFASLAHGATRAITLGLSLPFTLLWAFGFSYDVRNHALALPFLGWSLAGGAVVVHERLAGRVPRIAATGALALALCWIALFADTDALRDASEQQMVAVGKPALNRRLLEHQREHGFDGKILTNYRYLTSFEELRELYFVDRDAPGMAFFPFRAGVEHFARVVDDPANDIGFVLLSGLIDPDIEAFVRARVRARAYEAVFQVSGGRLFRIRTR